MVAGTGGEDDINVAEFEKYREAKKLAAPKAATFDLNQNKVKEIEKKPEKEGYLVDRRPTTERLFEEDAGKKGKKDKGKDADKDKNKGKDADKDKNKDKNKGKEDKKPAPAPAPPAPPPPPPTPPPPPPPKEVEEVETIVEYTLIRDPNKKKKKSTAASKKKKDLLTPGGEEDTVDGMNLSGLYIYFGVSKKWGRHFSFMNFMLY